MKAHSLKYLSAIGTVLLLAGCAGGSKPLYYHGNFHSNVYENLKNEDTSVSKQIEKMEKYFSEAERKQLSAVPGAHAHLGMLLVHARQQNAAFREFETEKKLFPESTAFMDFLMKKPANPSVNKGVKK